MTDRGGYYTTPTTTEPSVIAHLDFASGRITTLFTLPKAIDLGLAVSPDGRYLLFAQAETYGADLMLVDRFQ